MKLIELFLENQEDEFEGVNAIALVDKPAIELPFQYFSKQEMVEPTAGESKDEYISRCIPVLIGEGKPEDQAAAICYSQWQNRFFDVGGNPNVSSLPAYIDQVPKKGDEIVSESVLESTLLAQPIVSFDWDQTLSTPEGQELAQRYRDNGYKVIIITGRREDQGGPVIEWARANGVEGVYFTQGEDKWPLIKELGVAIHVDNNADQIRKVLENTDAAATLFFRDPVEAKEAHELLVEVLASLLGEEMGAEFGFDHKRFAAPVTAPEVDKILTQTELENGDQTLNNGDVRKLRYRYVGPRDSKNRALCAKLLGLNRLYNRIDLNEMNRIIPSGAVPRPKGGVIDLYQWKGGANCRHAWEQVIFTESPRGAIRIESTQIVSPVNPPASQGKRFSAFALDEEKRIVIGPVMVPDMHIDRIDEHGNFYKVFFSKETVAALAKKFAKELRLPDTNVDHKSSRPADTYVYETWIVENPEKDKSAIYGYNLPVGTWMASMKVESDNTWALIKQGYLRGFSIEGYFSERIIND